MSANVYEQDLTYRLRWRYIDQNQMKAPHSQALVSGMEMLNILQQDLFLSDLGESSFPFGHNIDWVFGL